MIPAIEATLFARHLDQHRVLFARLSELEYEVEQAAQAIADRLAAGGKLLLCGNGGSAADCQHIASELTGRFTGERRPLAALALTTDSSALTAIGNDYGFEAVFERQLRGLGRRGDCLLAVSTSGNSANVRRAAEAARELGILVIGLLGHEGGALRALCDRALVVPGSDTARIQEAHIFIAHTLCALVEDKLGLVSPPGG